MGSSFETSVKVLVGTVLSLLIACDLSDDSNDEAGAETGSGATGSAATALVPIGGDALCKHLINDCASTQDQASCLANYLPLRVSVSCAASVTTASCTDLADPSSGISQTCFPTCDPTTVTPVCNGNGTVTLCTTASTLHVNDCAQSCTSDGYTSWTGSCGTSFNNESSPNGQNQCWCQ